jgi:hypothetical protein
MDPWPAAATQEQRTVRGHQRLDVEQLEQWEALKHGMFVHLRWS